jgi:hypothetical protein
MHSNMAGGKDHHRTTDSVKTRYNPKMHLKFWHGLVPLSILKSGTGADSGPGVFFNDFDSTILH